jgi:hypothetical protein
MAKSFFFIKKPPKNKFSEANQDRFRFKRKPYLIGVRSSFAQEHDLISKSGIPAFTVMVVAADFHRASHAFSFIL